MFIEAKNSSLIPWSLKSSHDSYKKKSILTKHATFLKKKNSKKLHHIEDTQHSFLCAKETNNHLFYHFYQTNHKKKQSLIATSLYSATS